MDGERHGNLGYLWVGAAAGAAECGVSAPKVRKWQGGCSLENWRDLSYATGVSKGETVSKT